MCVVYGPRGGRSSHHRRATVWRRRRPPAPVRGPAPGPADRRRIRARTQEGERLDGHQVIDLALDAIARASARA